jgi:polyphosphate kinase
MDIERSKSPLKLTDRSLYINRELSLLEFQRRLLEEARDERNPLLERLKFIAIFGSNMDEYFMVRVSGVRRLVEAQINDLSMDGLTPRDQLAAMRRLSNELFKDAQTYLTKKLFPRLDKAGVHVLNYAKLNKTQKKKVDEYFQEVIHPVLTPLALDPGHPFPHISNLSLSLAIVIRDPKGNEKFARIKVPDTLPRLIPIKRSSGGVRKDGTIARDHYFVWLEQVIAANIGTLFPGMQVIAAHPFRTIRDADIEIQEIEADDLLETMQQSIRRRKFGSVVQITAYESMPQEVRELLTENLEIKPNDINLQASPMGLASLWQIYNHVERHDLKYPAYIPRVPKPLRNIEGSDDFFAAIQEKNILVHHPYNSFSSVVDFLNAAARDPHVLAIKQTLYRVGNDSPIVEALLEASERGKQVAVLLELKARFDEESNISWARKLEQAGVHVVYGLMGLKTHSKVALVVRREGDGIRRYVHLATGNYNAVTSSTYEDMGMFTADEAIGTDATDLFNYLTGYSTQHEYKKLLVAPVSLRQRLESMIRRETEIARSGKPARLIFKANALVDPAIIQLLYEASQAGVRVDLLVRGICCLRPGIKGISENIQVISVIGRYLEHSRIYYFHNGGAEEIYLGSADLMSRNLNRRVEVVFPIEDRDHIRHIREEILETYLHKHARVRFMQKDGSYTRNLSKEKQTVDVQELLMEQHGRLK